MGVLFRASVGFAIAIIAYDPQSVRDWLRDDIAPIVRPECAGVPCGGADFPGVPAFSLSFLVGRAD